MGRPRAVLATLLAAGLALTATAAGGATGRAGGIWRVSTASNGAEGNGDAVNSSVAITPNGRYVVFASAAANLVPGDTDGEPDVFRRDRATGRTELVSAGLHGQTGHYVPLRCAYGAQNPTISDSGRFVAFESCYDNLVAGDTNVADDIFVRDMVTGITTRVSVTSKGAQANGTSTNAMISANGNAVAFTSTALNLDPKTCDADSESQVMCASPVGPVLRPTEWIFVRDLTARTTALVSVTPNGHLPDGSNDFPSISATGRYVAYNSTADNLTTNDTNNQCTAELGADAPSCEDVFLYDRHTRRTELISVGLNGDSANADSETPGSTLLISTDGRYVAFQSGATNIVPNARSWGVYVRDRTAHRTIRVSVLSNGADMSIGDGMFAMTPNGRFVVMDDAEPLSCSLAPIVIARYDIYDGSMELEDRTNAAGHDQGCDYYRSNNPATSADGRYVAFVSTGSGLVAGDTNGKADVFVRDRGPATGVGGLTGSQAAHASGDLVGAQLLYRPRLHDLFVRLRVAAMPAFALASPAVVYALDVTSRGHRYEVRVAKTGPTTASFGLFEQTATGWAFVANLTGGYGTTGQEVVAAVPLDALGSAGSSLKLTDATAVTGLGSYLTGIARVNDAISLR